MQKIKICALILLALCLAVSAVNALQIIVPSDNGKVIDLGQITNYRIPIEVSGPYVANYFKLSGDDSFTQSPGYIDLPTDKTSVILIANSNQPPYHQPYEEISLTLVYNTFTPEPPEPEVAYLTATLLSESNTGLTYQIKPMPDDGTYLFSKVNTGVPSAVDSTIIYSSEDAAINYIISRGTSQTFYCNYKKGYWGLPHTMNITLSAPIYSDDVLINATIINNTLQNLPNPINPSPSTNNALVSGAWSPIGRDAVISSAFADIVRNGGVIFSLPHMASPAELRASLLNNTGNITAPLYDFIDSASGMVLFLPDILGNAVGSVLNAISETVSIIKTYIDYIFGLLDTCMDFFYVLLPVIYVLIPDVVWWCFTAALCYYIIKWILIMVLGYDVVSAYLTDSQKGDED